MWLVGLAGLCVALMMGVRAPWLRLLTLTMAAWTPETSPADRTHHHRRHLGVHRLRATLAVLALALALLGLCASPTG